MNYYDGIGAKQYTNHAGSPAISLYFLSDDAPKMDKLSCIWCKRTIADVKGKIDQAVNTPMPVEDFGIAINIRCKLCKQDYRLIMSESYKG